VRPPDQAEAQRRGVLVRSPRGISVSVWRVASVVGRGIGPRFDQDDLTRVDRTPGGAGRRQAPCWFRAGFLLCVTDLERHALARARGGASHRAQCAHGAATAADQAADIFGIDLHRDVAALDVDCLLNDDSLRFGG
jgi:hypothetical protein